MNADHTHSLDKVKEAAEAGFDEILFDGSALPMDENISQTTEAVKIVRAINPEIVMEGEIGYIGSSSEIIAEAAASIAHAFDARGGRAIRAGDRRGRARARGREHARAFGGDGRRAK